jgi:hypothetical protein
MLKLAAGSVKFPIPAHLFHTNKRVCMNFCVQGFVCKLAKAGKQCHMLHPAKLEDLPIPFRQTFADWVGTQPTLEWVPGKGPAGTV